MKKRVLYISQEIFPYVGESEIASLSKNLPYSIQKHQETRLFMPKYGCINERRNQLHEVIRLSGMNLVIDDYDNPLIIKVASIPATKLQVYFIDNDDFFPKRSFFNSRKGEFLKFTDERMIFFCRAVLQTVIKLGWKPDLIHCHGWMTSLVPFYFKKIFSNEPIYKDEKIIYSCYKHKIPGKIANTLAEKSLIDDISLKDVKSIKNPTHANLTKFAIDYSDAVITGQNVSSNIVNYIKEKTKMHLFPDHSKEDYPIQYSEFYDKILEK